MREVRLWYRIHVMNIQDGSKFYAGQPSGLPDGFLFPDRDEAERWKVSYEKPDEWIADIEEYETNPKENDNA
jgi:hypothetical protein